MRDGYGCQASQPVDFLDSFCGQEGAIPEDVAGVGLDKESSLADGDSWPRCDAQESRLFLLAGVFMILSKLVSCCPTLPMPTDELTLVLTDGATIGRRLGLGVLDAAV